VRKHLEDDKDALFLSSNLVQHFGKDGIQPALTQAVLQRVERLCAHYFGSLHSSAKAMTLDCQKYSKSIQEGEWCTPVNLLSGGELRRLQLASFLAFSQLTLEKANVSMDLRIFDEPCAPLDAAGHVAFLKQIKELYPRHKTILISHADIPGAFAEHHVKIKSRGLYRSSI
jgi:ABC-type cobalamin transport system ATPase subunit